MALTHNCARIAALLASTALISLAGSPALAQGVIDGGTVETVIGTGVGTKTSPWNLGTDDLYVGNAGTGRLDISAGGAVSNSEGYIGVNSYSTGFVTVDGAGSTWTNSGDLYVGDYGRGWLDISAEGAVSNSYGYIGYYYSSNGTVTVADAGSTWTNSNSTLVGYFGTGRLDISAGGAVSNSYGSIGTFSGSNGTVTVAGAGSRWTNSNDLYVGYEGTGRLDLSAGGTVSTQLLRLGSQSGSNGTLNIGAAAGVEAVAAGTLNASGGVLFGGGTGTLNFNHTNTDYTFGAAISNGTGAATINHIAGVTKLTGDSSLFTGTTNVTGGTLYFNGLYGGSVNLLGGKVGGSGSVGNVTLGSGSTIAPGNSIGTMNVVNITMAAGSTYTVELNNGGFVAGTNNDFINATGTATIFGGTVHVTPVNGTDTGTTYTPGTYTILTATAGVTGTFATLTDDYAFLNFALGYDANNVLLTSSLTATTFCLTGMTENQCAAGTGTFSLGSGSLYTAVLNLSTAQAPGAMDQLSGEIHASAKTALLEDSRFAREAALDRLRDALGGTAKAGQATAETPEGTTIWAQGFGAWSRWNGDGNAAELSRNIGGLFMGADGEVTDNVDAGLMGGYSRSALSVADRMSSGTVDSYTLGAYAGGNWDAFSLKGGLAHAWHNLATSRSAAFTGFSDSLSASYNARTFQAYTEAAYSIEYGNARFEPFVNLAWVNLATDGFTETGGAAALTANGQNTNAAFTTLGIRGETQVDVGETTATVNGGLGWRHAFGNTPTATHNFAGGNAFTVAGVPLARDALVLDAGLEVNLTDNATLGLSYNGQLGSGITEHSAKAGFNLSF